MWFPLLHFILFPFSFTASRLFAPGLCVNACLLGLCQEQLERMWHLAGSNLDGQNGLSANTPRHNRGLDLEKIYIYCIYIYI